MRILIVSDIHGNWPALQAVLAAAPPTDEVLCLGDLVNYGPQPVECVAWAMEHVGREWLVQGNHDRAVGRGEDPHCSVAYATLAAATQAVSSVLLTDEMKRFLAELEPLQRFQLGEPADLPRPGDGDDAAGVVRAPHQAAPAGPDRPGSGGRRQRSQGHSTPLSHD